MDAHAERVSGPIVSICPTWDVFRIVKRDSTRVLMDESDGLIVRMTDRETDDHFSSRAAANIINEKTERAAPHAIHVAPATTNPQNSIRPIFTFFVF